MDFGLSNFQGFITWILSTVADFLLAPPIIWIVGLLFTALVVKIFISLITSIRC